MADTACPDTAATEPVEVVVVIVTHESADVLPACLASLPQGLVGLRWQVIVVDNGSVDETMAVARNAAPDVTIVEMGRNAGHAAAVNAAMAAAPPCDAFLVLNADVRLDRGCGVRLWEALRRPGVGIAVPSLVDEDRCVLHSLRREPTVLRAASEALLGGRRASRLGRLGEVVGHDDAYADERPTDWATGAALLVSAACAEDVGAWDESFVLYSEEADFALRARDRGWTTWFTPTATATAAHRGGESNTSPHLWAILTANRVRLFRKRHGRLSSSLFWLAIVVNELLRAARSETHRLALGVLPHRAAVPIPAEARPPSSTTPSTSSGAPGWVCFAGVDWWYHNRAHSDIQLMKQIADECPVLFVNSIGMRTPRPGRSTQPLRRVARKATSILRFLRRPLADRPSFHVVSPVVVPFYGSRAARALNALLVRAQVRFSARRAGIDLARSVVFVTLPTAWEVVRALPHRLLVFNRSDLHSAFEEVDQPYIRSVEGELLARSDLVVYASHALLDAERERTGERAVHLDHGVDVDRFTGSFREPADLAAIPHPRVGFFGGIDDYVVDLDLLEQVAAELPDASLVIIGDATCSMDRLTRHPNVHWLGYRPYEEIPAYGAGFDVGIMPWLRNEWIEHANPIKLREYLCLGLPVVSTAFPEVEYWRDVVAVADDDRSFVGLVREALDGQAMSTPTGRRARVEGSTWCRQARRLLELTDQVGS